MQIKTTCNLEGRSWRITNLLCKDRSIPGIYLAWEFLPAKLSSHHLSQLNTLLVAKLRHTDDADLKSLTLFFS